MFRTKPLIIFYSPSLILTEDKLMFEVFWKDIDKIEVNQGKLPLIPIIKFKKTTHILRFVGNHFTRECNLTRFQELKQQDILINLETYANKLKKPYKEN